MYYMVQVSRPMTEILVILYLYGNVSVTLATLKK